MVAHTATATAVCDAPDSDHHLHLTAGVRPGRHGGRLRLFNRGAGRRAGRSAESFRRTNPGRAWRTVQDWVKRAVDVVVSLALLAVLAPVFAVIAVLVRATDGGPALFWQTRVGRNGREFWFPKFRSMVPNADKMLEAILHLNDHKSGVTFKIKRDPRVTWIGRILRRTSLDELPQLWCVLAGHMTLVGPRPAVPREVAQYTPVERRRLDAVPGLTCVWQVSGRGDLPFAKQVEMDVWYIENRSLWLDLKLAVLTIPAVLSGKGAY